MPTLPPNLLANASSWIQATELGGLGLVLDFDGTISELVPVPDDAAIHPDVALPLRSLTSRLGLTVIMSGRPANDIWQRVRMDNILYVGNHGVEYLFGGELTLVPQAIDLPISPEALAERLKPIGDGPGIVWEVKQFSLAIHYRMSPDKTLAGETLNRALETVPEIKEMEVISGNMVLEIRGRNGVNKGYAIDKIVNEHDLQSLVFMGDDTTDVDALRALRMLNEAGKITGTGVAVIQQGMPSAVLENADYSLNGVTEVAEFLGLLNDATPS